MIVLAIDPGTKESGYVQWSTQDRVIMRHGNVDNEEMRAIVNGEWYGALAIEMPAAFGMRAGGEIFETCYWVGRFAESGLRRCISPARITRHEVRQHLLGRQQNAGDKQIRLACIARLGGMKALEGMLKGITTHQWSALAVALTFEARCMIQTK